MKSLLNGGPFLGRAVVRISMLAAVLSMAACGGDDDNGGSEADRLGVGAACADDADCAEEGQACLDNFKGGYCGVAGCEADADCPAGSLCAVLDGANYCFLSCENKSECNTHRSVDDEANCSGSVEYVEAEDGPKACIPPSGA